MPHERGLGGGGAVMYTISSKFKGQRGKISDLDSNSAPGGPGSFSRAAAVWHYLFSSPVALS
jgi:hypothetical protein